MNRILLVRLREIGDVVLTTPAVHAIRTRFPHAHLAYVVEPAAAPVVLNNPHLDRVIVAPRQQGLAALAADVRLGRKLRAERYDLAVDFHGGPRACLLTWMSRAPMRIGYHVIGRSWVYTRLIDRPRALRARHSVENQWDLLTPLDIASPDRQAFPVEMPLDAAAARNVADRLTQADVRPSDRLIVMHVSAGNPFRRWPIEHFVQLVTSLLARDGLVRVIVTSGPSEADAADRVLQDARARLDENAARRILTAGEFSLAELRALLERAALYIGGDSGPLHIAATTRVPIVALYGPTLPARSVPWRAEAFRTESVEVGALPCRPCEQRVCEPGDFRCLVRITPEQVLEAAIRCLS